MKRITQQEFVDRGNLIHNGKYDYSKTVFVSTKKKVCIICPEHGEFWQYANNHLQGYGCAKCAQNNVPQFGRRRLVFGVGVNDSSKAISKHNIRNDKDYYLWHGMIQRCYDDYTQKIYPTYNGCTVCDEWLYFSNFKKWFDENYIEGYQLDKDILVKGNKVYSPDTCCFVPFEINTLFTKSNAKRGVLPIGVQHYAHNRFLSCFKCGGKVTYLGVFDKVEDAFCAYKQAKEGYIKEVAENYYAKGLITERVYKALLNYKVEITD